MLLGSSSTLARAPGSRLHMEISGLGVFNALLGAADYRAYLARGVLLGSDGRKADAQRMFLQARPHALDVAAMSGCRWWGWG